MPLEIDRIAPDSLGEEIGLNIGDRVLVVNGSEITDPLDWRFHIADELVEILVESGGEQVIYEIEKEYDDDLGVHLKGPGFRKCNNRCVFCFIDQNPKNVRKTLKFKDEDYRLSFLYGNYVTLTNIPEEELRRTAEQRLSPLYVSVHATDIELRRRLLGNPKAPDILPIMRRLIDDGISLHTQIVLMPGLNDKDQLDRTVDDLIALYPGVGSVCIVPVGLSDHRSRLPELRRFSDSESADLVSWLGRRQKELLTTLGQRFVFISDEFFLMCGSPMPLANDYEGFPQVGNGVGMVRQLLDGFEVDYGPFADGLQRAMTVDLVTAPLVWKVLEDLVRQLNEIECLSVVPHVVTNEFYGDGITVSGLLSGRDILTQLSKKDLTGDVMLLPPNVLNDDGVFLDDMSLKEFGSQIGIPAVCGSYDLIESLTLAADTLGSSTDTDRLELPTVHKGAFEFEERDDSGIDLVV